MPQKISTVFWDLDGTLINSEDIHNEAGFYATVMLGQQPLVKEIPAGLSNTAVFELLFGQKANADRTLFSRWENLIVEYALDRIDASHQISQSVQLFQQFSDRGIVQAVVSNSVLKVIEHSLQKLGIYNQCAQIFSSDSVINPKPHPELYLSALKFHQVEAQSCLAFEDSYSGIMAAKSAGLNVIGIGEQSSGYNPNHICSFDAHNWIELLNIHYTF